MPVAAAPVNCYSDVARRGMKPACGMRVWSSAVVRHRLPAAAGLAVLFCVVASTTGLAGDVNRTSSQRCGGETFRLSQVAGGSAPYVHLSAGGQSGAFLLDYGTTSSTVSRARFPVSAKARDLTLGNFSLPSFRKGRFAAVDYANKAAPAGGQLGVVGTDFLSLLTADFSYRPGQADVVLSAAPCDAARLIKRGLVPISQAGFFSNKPGKRRGARPNVPVVFVRFGAVVAWGQVDTGYDDLTAPLSIDINDALYAKLQSAGVDLRRRSDVVVSTCAGSELRPAYEIASVTVQSDKGLPIRQFGHVTLLRKTSKACGGIAQLSEPAAQVAASLLREIGEVVIDPKSKTVWLKPDPAARRHHDARQ